MAMMKNYELTSGGGPIFNKPACSVSYPYSSNTKNAADISSVWDYIDGILSSISSLSNDFESIKNKIRSLEDNWNNCIIMNGVGNEYVYVDDVNGDITSFSSKCESGKGEVDGIFSEFSGTIAEINEYMNLLKENGMVFSGINESSNLVEIIEIPKHKHFIACQFHPEFKSRPTRPHPLFDSFIKASIKNKSNLG